MARHPRWTRRLFSDADLDAVVEAVRRAEAGTSGEIRVHLDRRLPRGARGQASDALERAREVFAHLGMHRTAERNAVLVYFAVEDRRVAIVGDEAVHARVGDGYWEGVRDLMVEKLRSGAPGSAVLAAIGEAGRVLREHFPRRPDDQDELSDEVSMR